MYKRKKISSERGTKPSFFYTTHFMTKLLDEGNTESFSYHAVKNWSEKCGIKDIFDLQKLYIPCNETDYHWSLVVINMVNKSIKYFDSIQENEKNIRYNVGGKFVNAEWEYIVEEWKQKQSKSLIPMCNEWMLEPSALSSRKQARGSLDCGIFVCLFMDLDSLNFPLNFSQKDINENTCEKLALSFLKRKALIQ